jgi:hypothetical protein
VSNDLKLTLEKFLELRPSQICLFMLGDAREIVRYSIFMKAEGKFGLKPGQTPTQKQLMETVREEFLGPRGGIPGEDGAIRWPYFLHRWIPVEGNKVIISYCFRGIFSNTRQYDKELFMSPFLLQQFRYLFYRLKSSAASRLNLLQISHSLNISNIVHPAPWAAQSSPYLYLQWLLVVSTN